MPPHSLEFCFFLRVEQWLHASVVERIRFDQINDVEFVGVLFLRVGDFKVKPLGQLGLRVEIKLDLEIVFKLCTRTVNPETSTYI